MAKRHGAAARWLANFVMEPAFRRRVEFLGLIPLFSGLPRSSLTSVLESLTARDYGRGENLCEEGAVGRFLFIIESGTVDVVYRDGGKNHRAATLGPGKFFGELSVLSDHPRSATVVALEPVKAYLLYKTELEKLVREEPETGAVVMQRLAQLLAARLLSTQGGSEVRS